VSKGTARKQIPHRRAFAGGNKLLAPAVLMQGRRRFLKAFLHAPDDRYRFGAEVKGAHRFSQGKYSD
jgi:hypothetical protein